AAEARQRITLAHSPDQVVLDTQALRQLPAALQRRALRQAIAHVRGHLQNIPFQLLENVLTALETPGRHRLQLPADGAELVSLAWDAERLTLLRITPAADPVPWRIPLVVPGHIAVPMAGMVLETRIYPAPGE